MNETKHCFSCGSIVNEDDEFCPKCGAKLKRTAVLPSYTDTLNEEESCAKNKSTDFDLDDIKARLNGLKKEIKTAKAQYKECKESNRIDRNENSLAPMILAIVAAVFMLTWLILYILYYDGYSKIFRGDLGEGGFIERWIWLGKFRNLFCCLTHALAPIGIFLKGRGRIFCLIVIMLQLVMQVCLYFFLGI